MRHWTAIGARRGPAGSGQAVADAGRAVHDRDGEVLHERGFWRPSSMTTTVAPWPDASLTPPAGPATRWSAPNGRGGAVRRPLRRPCGGRRPGSVRREFRRSRAGESRLSPMARSMPASARAVGVLPAPPAVKLPMQITGRSDVCRAGASSALRPRRRGGRPGRAAGRRAKVGAATRRPAPASEARSELHLDDEGFDRLERALDRAAERLHGVAGGPRHFPGQGRDSTGAG